MTINQEIAAAEEAIRLHHHAEACHKAARMQMTVVLDSLKHRRDLLVRHIVEDVLDIPTPDDVAEATEYLYGDGMTASEAYLAHVRDSFDNFDIEQGADL